MCTEADYANDVLIDEYWEIQIVITKTMMKILILIFQL